MLHSESAPSQDNTHASLAILEVLQGAWIARSVEVAASLGLADLLKDGPKTTSALAQATGTHEPALFRLLRSLASVGVFTDVEPGSFAQTPLSDALRTDRPDSICQMTRMLGEEWQTRIWENLEYSIRTGQPAFPQVYQTTMPEFILQHPAEGKRINLGLTSFSAMVNAPIAQAYDFSAFETLVDLGGGLGSLLTTILKAYPPLKGMLFERPAVIEAARGYIEPELQERCQLVAGNFFEAVPTGADAYLLKQVIHDWSDEDSIKILRTCRKVIKPDGKVLIADRVIQADEGPETRFNKFWDLLMLVIAEGRERTEEEFSRLYEAAGFRLTRVVATGTPISVVEGRPV